MQRKTRHHAYAITEEERSVAVQACRDRQNASYRRFQELSTQLMRKMPADHAALKAAIRELRDCHHDQVFYGGRTSQAWAEDNIGHNRHDINLSELLRLVQAVAYRYAGTRRRDRPYIDLALDYIAHQVDGAVAMHDTLLRSRAMRLNGDEATKEDAA